MKIRTLVCGSLVSGITGCSSGSPDPEARIQIPTEIRANVSMKSVDLTDKPQLRNFDIVFGGLKMAATIDEYKNVTVMNYPDEWHGKMSLIHYSGSSLDVPAFWPEHCETIRNTASYGITLPLIRSAYHSVISFELPPFMSPDFMSAVLS